MKTIIFHTNEKPIIMDIKNNDARILESADEVSKYNIDGIYCIPEDCEIRYKDGNRTIVKKANKDDIIFTFSSFFKNRVVLIKNNDLKENVILRRAEIEARRAKDTVLSECCDCTCAR